MFLVIWQITEVHFLFQNAPLYRSSTFEASYRCTVWKTTECEPRGRTAIRFSTMCHTHTDSINVVPSRLLSNRVHILQQRLISSIRHSSRELGHVLLLIVGLAFLGLPSFYSMDHSPFSSISRSCSLSINFVPASTKQLAVAVRLYVACPWPPKLLSKSRHS